MIHSIDNIIAKALSIDMADILSAISRSSEINKNPFNGPIKKLLEKAKRGEEITIAFFGGSITEGAWATSYKDIGNNAQAYTKELGGELCYALRVAKWFEDSFSKCKVNVVNAGIGATPSFLGVYRMNQMVLNHNPDLVIIEFAINDVTAYNLKEGEIFSAYETIVRRCVDRNIASMLVFTLNEKGSSMQDYYTKIGDYYRIPMISYRDGIMPKGKLIFDRWNMISPDVVHPNNVGHALIGRMITDYLENIDNSDTIPADILLSKPNEWLNNQEFYNSELYSACDNKDCAKQGFIYTESIKDVSHKWRGAWTCNGENEAKIEFTVPKGAKKVFLLWFPATGSFKAKFSDVEITENTAYPPDKYERADWTRIYDGDKTCKESLLTIESNQDGALTVMGVMVSY